MTETRTTKTRTITLKGRNPVKIKENEWPVIAKATWSDSPGCPWQANHRAAVRVRQHADGRVIVYGTSESELPHVPDLKSGMLLAPGADVVGAIYQVVSDIDMAAEMAARCVADLPAEEI